MAQAHGPLARHSAAPAARAVVPRAVVPCAVARCAAALCAAALCGCASAPQPAHRAPPASTPAQAPPPVSYDWRPLRLVPFGTLLKDMPVALNEVVPFHEAGTGAQAQSSDCFSMDGASPPSLNGRRPELYHLCFEHDRLHRIEAQLRLAPAEAQPLLAALCAQWFGRAPDRGPAADGCTGSEADTGISVEVASAGDSPDTLSITLSDESSPPRE